MHPPSLTMHCLSPPFTVIYCSNTFLQQPRDLPFKYFSTAASWSTIQILFYSTLVIYCSNNFLQKPRDLPFKYFPTAALWCRPLLGGAPAPLQYDSFCHQLLSCTLCVTVRTLCVTVCTLCVTVCHQLLSCTLCVTSTHFVATLCATHFFADPSCPVLPRHGSYSLHSFVCWAVWGLVLAIWEEGICVCACLCVFVCMCEVPLQGTWLKSMIGTGLFSS
jgi:hypothetical protein